MSDTTDCLDLPLILPAQAQKHVTHNEALLALDALVQLVVLDRSRSAPPPAPASGDRHLVAAAATGLWAGCEGQIALWSNGEWRFFPPRPGWQAYIRAENALAVFDGSAWTTPGEGAGSHARLGISASADAVNRLSVASPAVLFNHAGSGMQLKLNKAAPAATASLLFQSAFSGRAEMGCAGNDDFSVKVSSDGTGWSNALVISRTTGAADFPAGLSRAGSALYSRADLLGPVSQAAGLPSGAVIERGTGSNGEYLRLADGSQICWHAGLSVTGVTTAAGAGFTSAAFSWTFPQPFVTGSVPVVSGLARSGDCWLSQSTAGPASASLRLLSFLSKSGAVQVSAMAVGRWI